MRRAPSCSGYTAPAFAEPGSCPGPDKAQAIEQTERERETPPAAKARSSRETVSVIIAQDSDNIIRTQVSLDRHEYTLAKKAARAIGIPVAEFVRRAIREALPPQGDGPWMRYAGFVASGDPRSSRSIDEIVYGRKD